MLTGIFFIFSQILIENCMKNRKANDQTPHYAVSDLYLHCLPMSHKNDARLIWVKLKLTSI